MKVLASDLDGTLLNRVGKISPNNIAAIRHWQLDNLFVFASGRYYSNIMQLMHQYQIDGPMIALNGAMVLDQTGKVIFSNPIKDQAAVHSWINFFEKYHMIYTLYCQNGSYTRMYDEATLLRLARARTGTNDVTKISQNRNFYFHELYEKSTPVDNRLAMESQLQQPVLKVESFSEDADLLADIRNSFHSVNIVSSSPRNVEMMETGSSKGEAIRKLSEYYKVDLHDFYALGDGENDLSMFETVGTGIAMANARPEVLQASSWQTKSNLDDGVAVAIERILKG